MTVCRSTGGRGHLGGRGDEARLDLAGPASLADDQVAKCTAALGVDGRETLGAGPLPDGIAGVVVRRRREQAVVDVDDPVPAAAGMEAEQWVLRRVVLRPARRRSTRACCGTAIARPRGRSARGRCPRRSRAARAPRRPVPASPRAAARRGVPARRRPGRARRRGRSGRRSVRGRPRAARGSRPRPRTSSTCRCARGRGRPAARRRRRRRSRRRSGLRRVPPARASRSEGRAPRRAAASLGSPGRSAERLVDLAEDALPRLVLLLVRAHLPQLRLGQVAEPLVDLRGGELVVADDREARRDAGLAASRVDAGERLVGGVASAASDLSGPSLRPAGGPCWSAFRPAYAPARAAPRAP